VEQHPDKTFIGRIAHGFDFLGYHQTPTDIAPARQTLQNFVQRIARLYEQGADPVRIGQYVYNWWRWLCDGLSSPRDFEIREEYSFLCLFLSSPVLVLLRYRVSSRWSEQMVYV